MKPTYQQFVRRFPRQLTGISTSRGACSCYGRTPSRSTAFTNVALVLSGSILPTAFPYQMPSIPTQLNPQATHSHHFICNSLPSSTPIAINITTHFSCPRPLSLAPPNKHIAIPSIPHQYHTYFLLYTTSARHCLFQPCDSPYNFKISRKVPAAAFPIFTVSR